MPAAANVGARLFKTTFRHPTDPDIHGNPLCIKDWYPVKKQKYCYEISYSSDSIERFILPCPSLPYEISKDMILGIVILLIFICLIVLIN